MRVERLKVLLVSQAPLEKLQGYKRRMGWQIPWVSSSPGDFNFDLGFSQTEEQSREAVAQIRLPGQSVDAFPPVVEHNARSSGTDIAGYLTESPGFSTFVRDGDDVYHAYSTTWRPSRSSPRRSTPPVDPPRRRKSTPLTSKLSTHISST